MFANIVPQTQLVLPSDGSQTPGSGTTVIGGPLPPELVAAGYTGTGIIWWSTDGSYRYTFLVSLNGVMYQGAVNNAGTVIRVTATQYNYFNDTIGFHSNGSVGIDQSITVAKDAAVSGRLTAGSFGTPGFIMDTNGTDSYLTADRFNTTGLDKWSAVTAGPSGTFGGTTYTSTYRSFISFDRQVTISFSIVLAGAPGSVANLTVPILPLYLDAAAGSVFGTALTPGGPVACRATALNGNLVLFAVPNTAGTVAGSITYPTPKPTY